MTYNQRREFRLRRALDKAASEGRSKDAARIKSEIEAIKAFSANMMQHPDFDLPELET